MEFQIQFDKEQYFPGDTVSARFTVYGEPHKNTRGIRFILRSGENIAVTVTRSTGKHTHQETIWERTVYNEQMTELPIEQCIFPQEMQLQMTLPQFNSENHAEEQRFHIYHIGRIEVDIARRVDEFYEQYIPLIPIPIQPEIQKPEAIQDGLMVRLQQIPQFPNDQFSYEINMQEEQKFRSIRVELIQERKKLVRNHRREKKYKEMINQHQDQSYLNALGNLPTVPYSSIMGTAFEINTYLQFVFDRKLKKDINIRIPIPYYLQRVNGEYRQKEGISGNACNSCGFLNPYEAEFCSECGLQLYK